MRNRYDASELRGFIDIIVDQISNSFRGERINIVGIRTRGDTLAKRIAESLPSQGFHPTGFGTLDITLYRDDLSEIAPRPIVKPTEINFDLDGSPLILVDDVIFTGRTVRAALNELADFGRPRVVRLATLVDRGGRELPVQPDFCPLKFESLPNNFRVQVKLEEIDGSDEILIGEIGTADERR